MKSLLSLSRSIDRLNEQVGRLVYWLVLVAVLISAGNAISRYTLNLSSNAWLEIQWYMFGAMILLGASYTLKKNEHVRVDILYGHLSTRTQIWIDLIGGVLFLLPATIIISWLAWPMFHNSFLQNEISSNAGGLLRWPIKLMIPLGFWLLTLQGISEIIKRIAMLTGHLTANVHYERPLQ